VPAVSLSDHVRTVVGAEREAVAVRVEALRAQAERLHAVAEVVDRDVDETARLLRHWFALNSLPSTIATA
jgi:hypothetical protein